MARYDEWFDRPDRPGRRYAARPGRRAGGPRGPRRYAPGPAYGGDYPIRSRMGMHDFAERYGRYSGGSPYGYEYSERTIQHAHPRPEHDIGFTRPLEGQGHRRFPIYGRGYERRRSRAQRYRR